jgi:hypothetical protein
MNTITQTIAKLIILPLFGGALITGVAVGTADSAAATTKVTEWVPPPPAAQQSPSGHAVWDGEIVPSAPAAPVRPDVVLNGSRIAPADNARSGQQESPASNKKDGAKSNKGNTAR